MLYITIEQIRLNGTYTEPMWDEMPLYETYDHEVTVTIPPYTGMELVNGKIISIDMENTFGVSLHKGLLSLRESVNERIGSQIVKISEPEYREICGIREKRNELLPAYYRALEAAEIMESAETERICEIRNTDGMTQEQYRNYAELIAENALSYIGVLADIQKKKEQIQNTESALEKLLACVKRNGKA